MFILMKSGLGLYLGHLESGTRSLGQIIEKHCVDNRGHSFHLILMSQVSDSGPSWPSCLLFIPLGLKGTVNKIDEKRKNLKYHVFYYY
jgi:hypothetical protein